MAEICCDVISEGEASASASVSCDPSSRAARRRRMDIRRFKFVTDVAADDSVTVPLTTPRNENSKRLRLTNSLPAKPSSEWENVENNCSNVQNDNNENSSELLHSEEPPVPVLPYPKFSATAVCGRRREMEDAVAIHPSLCRDQNTQIPVHFFGLYDGHGCSHVAMSCKDRMHEIVKEELENRIADEWKEAMERSFSRMDEEVITYRNGGNGPKTTCRCDLQMPQVDAVGSTAVVSIVTPDKVIVANCGDSRALLCRDGKPVPLSTDHKPDLPEEQQRIQNAGGRVIYWDGPRVLGVLAMSRAIGDNYLKPYVSSEPEVTITERTDEDECLILASDGLWDVVSNETACGIARMCLNGQGPVLPTTATSSSSGNEQVKMVCGGENPDKACSDGALLLTKLALARRSADNVSVVVVDLRKAKTSSQQSEMRC